MAYLNRLMTAEDFVEMRKHLMRNPYRISNNLLCDFCAAKPPVAIYGANRTTVGQPIRCWRWSACADCVGLIENNRWQELYDRIFEATKVNFKKRNTPFTDQLLHAAVAHNMQNFFRDAIPDEDKKPDLSTAPVAVLELVGKNPRGAR